MDTAREGLVVIKKTIPTSQEVSVSNPAVSNGSPARAKRVISGGPGGAHAILEPTYLLLDLGAHSDADILLTPEFNYAAVAVIALP